MEQKFKRSRIMIETPVFRFHKFSTGSGTPVFVVPPHAGRHGNISQRIIDTCVNMHKSVYAYELKSATTQTNSTSIDDLICILQQCCQYIGQPVDMVCLCQGAWLGTIYTALFPETITRYFNFAGPINTKTGEDNIIERYCSQASINTHKLIVNASYGLQPGNMQWLAFAMVRPDYIFITRWFDLWTHIMTGDEQAIEKWKRNNDWYDSPVNLAGTWFLECLENHFMKNRLYNGTWNVLGEKVNLKNIACPVYLYAGGADEITNHKQVFDMGNKVSSTDIYCRLFPDAGHTKVFTGKKELKCFAEEF